MVGVFHRLGNLESSFLISDSANSAASGTNRSGFWLMGCPLPNPTTFPRASSSLVPSLGFIFLTYGNQEAASNLISGTVFKKGIKNLCKYLAARTFITALLLIEKSWNKPSVQLQGTGYICLVAQETG